MARLKEMRAIPEVQWVEDALGAVALFLMLYLGLMLTGPV